MSIYYLSAFISSKTNVSVETPNYCRKDYSNTEMTIIFDISSVDLPEKNQLYQNMDK